MTNSVDIYRILAEDEKFKVYAMMAMENLLAKEKTFKPMLILLYTFYQQDIDANAVSELIATMNKFNNIMGDQPSADKDN